MSSSCLTAEQLAAVLRGDPSGEAHSHLRSCVACRSRSRSDVSLLLGENTPPAKPNPLANPSAIAATHPAALADTHPAALADTYPAALADTHLSPSARAQPLPESPRGRTLGRYVLLELLGAGGMGIVYAAYDPDLDRKIALKVVRADFLGTALSDELRVRLLREAQALAQLSHPNVVTVHDVGVHEGQVFVAMEYLSGVSLRRWREEHSPSWQHALELLLNAGEGLSAAHAAGLIHRDFKPDNVLVCEDGRVCVMDFGLVHAASGAGPEAKAHASGAQGPEVLGGHGGIRRRITAPGAFIGTPLYMAPEQHLSRPTDERSDQFSFALALWEALYGERPFAGETQAELVAEMQAKRLRREPRPSRVPRRVRRLLTRALEFEPAERFATMRELLVALRHSTRSSRRKRWAAAGATLGVLVLGGASWNVVTHDPCEEVEALVQGVWDEPARGAMKRAFLATRSPLAEEAVAKVSAHLDAYTAAWLTQRREVCHRERSGEERAGELAGRRLSCLGRRLSDARALTALFAEADVEIVENAVQATHALGALEACRAGPSAARGHSVRSAEQLASGHFVRLELSKAQAQIKAGKYVEAAASAERSLERARELSDAALEAEALHAVSLTLQRRSRWKEAEAPLEAAALTAHRAGDDGLAAIAWTELLGVLAIQKRPGEARRWAPFARAAIDRVGPDDDLEGRYLVNLGLTERAEGRLEEAIASQERALELFVRALGPEHPRLAHPHLNRGVALMELGRHEEALEAYRRAEEIQVRVFGPEHPMLGSTYRNLGNRLLHLGQAREGLEYLKRSVAIHERAFHRDPRGQAITQINISVGLVSLGHHEEAIEVLERLEQTAAPLHAIWSYNRRAYSLLALGRAEEALEVTDRALAGQAELAKPAEAERVFTLFARGRAQHLLRRDREALETLKRAHALLEQGEATDPQPRGLARFALAELLAKNRTGRERARLLAEQALEDLRSGGGRLKPDVETVERWLAGMEGR